MFTRQSRISRKLLSTLFFPFSTCKPTRPLLAWRLWVTVLPVALLLSLMIDVHLGLAQSSESSLKISWQGQASGSAALKNGTPSECLTGQIDGFSCVGVEKGGCGNFPPGVDCDDFKSTVLNGEGAVAGASGAGRLSLVVDSPSAFTFTGQSRASGSLDASGEGLTSVNVKFTAPAGTAPQVVTLHGKAMLTSSNPSAGEQLLDADVGAAARVANGLTLDTVQIAGSCCNQEVSNEGTISYAIIPSETSDSLLGVLASTDVRSDLDSINVEGSVELTVNTRPMKDEVDLLIKRGDESGSAFTGNNIYQTIPSGDQIKPQVVKRGGTAIYQVRIENESNDAFLRFWVFAIGETDLNWSVIYKIDSTDVTKNITSTIDDVNSGGTFFPLILPLSPGESKILTIEMFPSLSEEGTKEKTVTIQAFMHTGDFIVRDSVQAIATLSSGSVPSPIPTETPAPGEIPTPTPRSRPRPRPTPTPVPTVIGIRPTPGPTIPIPTPTPVATTIPVPTPIPPVPLSKVTGKSAKVGDPIDASSGEFFFNMPIFDLAGPLPLRYIIFYRLHQSASGSFGSGFDHNIPRLALQGTQAVISSFNEDDNQLFFNQDASGNWQVETGVGIQYALKETQMAFYLMDPIAELVYVFEKGASGIRLRFIIDRNSNQLAYTYDGDSNRVIQITDGLGRSLSLTYDSNNHVASVTDQGGRKVSFVYSGSLLTSITDPLGQTTSFEYDATHTQAITKITHPRGNVPFTQTYADVTLDGSSVPRVTSQSDAMGNTTELSYDDTNNNVTETRPDDTEVTYDHHHENGLPRAITDPEGNQATFTQTGQGQLNNITDRIGDSTSLTYHAESGKLASITNAKGDTLTNTYTSQDQTFTNPFNGETVTFTFFNLTRTDFPDGTNAQFTYDARGNPVQRLDRGGEAWSYTYNNHGLPLTVTNPTGGVISYTYNPDTTLASSQDSDLGPTTYEYDEHKRHNKIIHPDGQFMQITYNLNDFITSITDENGHTYQYFYDQNDNPIKVIEPTGDETRFAYDLMDRVSQVTDKLGNVSTFSYDSIGRLSSITDPNGITTTLGYDPRGWLKAITQGGQTWQADYNDEGVDSSDTSPLGNTVTCQTDELGYTTAATNPLGQTVKLSRNSMSQITGITDPLSRTLNLDYDSSGLLTKVTMPVVGSAHYTRDKAGMINQITDLNGNVWTFSRTRMGRIQSTIDPLNNRCSRTYDNRGRLSQTTYPDGTSLTWSYDNTGNITRKTYSDGTDLQFSYDAPGRLTMTNNLTLSRDAEARVTGTEDQGTHFDATYNAVGRLKTVTYNNNTFAVTYTYDTATGLLSRVTDDLTNTRIDFSYDPDRQLVDITRSNGVNTNLSWDDAGQLTRIQDGGIIDIQYTYDAAGQITRADMNVPLDPADSITSRGRSSFTYDAASQVSSTGYRYDNRGRQITSPGHTYTWDAASRLTGIDGVTLEYNGLGDLVTRSDASATTHYCYNHAIQYTPIMAEKDEVTGQFLRYYVYTPEGLLLYLIDAQEANRVSFYHFDRTGSTLALTDTSGRVTDAYAYTPYGGLLAHKGETSQPFTFVGQFGVRQEGGSGNLYHMRARYYDADTAHFLSRDTLTPMLAAPQELNPYQYATQNPVMFIDPVGLLKLDPSKASKIGNSLVNGGKGSAKGQANVATKGRDKKLSWWEAALFGVVAQVPGSEEMVNLTRNKYRPPQGTSEYLGGGVTRDLIASPATLLKFLSLLSQDAFLIYMGDKGTYANFLINKEGNGYFNIATKDNTDFWITVLVMATLKGIELPAQAIEDGWTKIGEYGAYGYKQTLAFARDVGKEYGEDLVTVVAGTRKEQAELHNRLYASKNPINKSGIALGSLYFDYYKGAQQKSMDVIHWVSGWFGK